MRSPSSYCSTASIGKTCTADPRAIGLAWSPDGQHIAFLSDRDGGWALYLVKPDGNNQTKVFDLGPEYPDWLDQSISWVE